MSTEKSKLQHMVPTAYGQEVQPVAADDTLVHTVYQLNSYLLGSIHTDTQFEEFIGRVTQTLLNEINFDPNQQGQKAVFDTAYTKFRSMIIWAGKRAGVEEIDCKEISFYVAAVAAKQASGMTKAPNGFNISEMGKTLKRYFATRWEEAISETDQGQDLSEGAVPKGNEHSVGKQDVSSMSDVDEESALVAPRNQDVNPQITTVRSKPSGTRSSFPTIPLEITREKPTIHAQDQDYTSRRQPDRTVKSYRLHSESDAEEERQVEERNHGTQARFRAPQTLSPGFHRAATAWSESGSSRTGVSVNPDKYLPYFKKSGEIMEKHRREAALFAAKAKLPDGGPFKGMGDKRTIRELLTNVRTFAIQEGLDPIFYQAVLNALLSDKVKTAVPSEFFDTYEEVAFHLRERVAKLLKKYSGSENTERLEVKKRLANIRQNDGESLRLYTERFEDVVSSLVYKGVEVNEFELRDRFIQSLSRREKQEARLISLANPEITVEELQVELLSFQDDQVDRPAKKKEETSADLAQCQNCGRRHPNGACRLPKDTKCNACGKQGHVAAVCRQKKALPGDSLPAKKEAYRVEVMTAQVSPLTLDKLYDNTVPHLLCDIGHIEGACLLLDSGAEVSLMSREFYRMLSSTQIYETNTCHPLSIRGAFSTQPTQSSLIAMIPISYKGRQGRTTKTIAFVIVPYMGRPAILGRDALKQLQVTMFFESEDPVATADPPAFEVCHLTAEQWPYVPDEDIAAAELPSKSDVQISTAIKQRLGFDKNMSLIDSLKAVCAMGSLEFAKGYSVQLMELKSSEHIDTPEQKFAFFISWQLEDKAIPLSSWNSQKAIDALNDGNRQEWEHHLQDYEHASWWTNSTETDARYFPAGTVFPVLQSSDKTTKCRPCCDLRAANELSPRISATTDSVAQAIWKLRSILDEKTEVRQFDLAKAFYRIRVKVVQRARPVPIKLRVGNSTYYSDRLVFGLACGPSSLNVTQTVLNTIAEIYCELRNSPLSQRIIVMDDYLFLGNPEQNTHTISIFEALWSLTGFESPQNKRYTWGATPTRWLGCLWTWSKELSITRMPIEPPPANFRLTKRAIFKIAGQFLEGSASLHETLARAHADTLRSLAGRTEGWDSPIVDKDLVKRLNQHVVKAFEEYELARTSETTVPLIGSVQKIACYTDASLTGYGFMLMDAETNIVLFSYARLFQRNQWIWHINRKELFSAAQALEKAGCSRWTPTRSNVWPCALLIAMLKASLNGNWILFISNGVDLSLATSGMRSIAKDSDPFRCLTTT